MNDNIHYISKGKAPPGEWRVQSIVQNVFPHLGGNVRRTKGVTCNLQLAACSFFNGTLLLNMRDGPRSREPAIRYITEDGVPVTHNKKSSAVLCAFSVSSVVNKTMEGQKCTRHHRAIYTQNPTKTFRDYCTAYVRLQEEKLDWKSGRLILSSRRVSEERSVTIKL